MELLESMHAAAGMVVAIFGLLQILLKKGGGVHALMGFAYLIAWSILACTGFALEPITIGLLGLFGFYLAITGWRFAGRRRKAPSTMDKVTTIIGTLLSIYILVTGCILISSDDSMGWTAIVIGVLFLLLTIIDIIFHAFKKRTRRPSTTRKTWMLEHMTRMYLSYFAALTIITVVYNLFFNTLFNWITPVIVGVILILFSRMYQSKKIDQKEHLDRS